MSNESHQAIAREAADKLANMLGLSHLLEDEITIILAAIERSHEPASEKCARLGETYLLGNHDCEYDSDGAPCNLCGVTASKAIEYFERNIHQQPPAAQPQLSETTASQDYEASENWAHQQSVKHQLELEREEQDQFEQPTATDDKPKVAHPTMGHDMAPITTIQTTDDRVKEQGAHTAGREWKVWYPSEGCEEADLAFTIDGVTTNARLKTSKAKLICDAHNAALAVERQKRDRIKQDYDLISKIQKTEVHLLNKQLNAAQLSIAEHNKQFENDPRLAANLIDIDLSALDKRDREQQRFGRAEGRADERENRKPLVDALEAFREYLTETASSLRRMGDTKFATSMERFRDRTLALAKAKP
jgi:hypothetical protein